MEKNVYRFNVKDIEILNNYLQSSKVYLKSDSLAENIEQLKANLLDEEKYSKRNLKSIINGFYRINEDDLILLKANDSFAIGRILDVCQFTNQMLTLSADIYLIDAQELPISSHFTGVQMQKLPEELFSQCKKIYDDACKKSLEENRVGTTLKLKEKNELMKIDDFQISYKKKEKKEPSFEMIIEMHPPKNTTKTLSLVSLNPADYMIMDPREIIKSQLYMYYNFVEMSTKLFLNTQKLFIDSFLEMLS